ncbi:MAG TPA: hypothetical protein VGD40_03475 [Chryseosolibacter sp.]
MSTKTFIPVWNKYRPVILKMMIDSSNEEQTYQLSQHEFKALNPKQKGGFTFKLQVANGKAKNGLKDSILAQDLWDILQYSPKATELIADSEFEFAMDKNFVLHVQKLTPVM